MVYSKNNKNLEQANKMARKLPSWKIQAFMLEDSGGGNLPDKVGGRKWDGRSAERPAATLFNGYVTHLAF